MTIKRWLLGAGFSVMLAGAVSAQVTSNAQHAAEPFAFGDFTWLNGNGRVKNPVIDTPYFTGTFFIDSHYTYDFNHPKDHTIDGTTELGRAQEFQVQDIGIGGDFHYQNVRGRIMTQLGLMSTMTPRNDQSPARGQWDLANSYRYISEAYGGYHWDIWNGINLDAGLFMSYVGLFSYYNNENWAYQPSYVSSNTPWFFNGLRLQTFPSDRLKIEYWLINGWQSYGSFNEAPGIGCQVLWRPNENISILTNNYMGYDTQNTPDRMRFHSDSSLQVKYLDEPAKWLSKAAFSLTADLGFESGGGVNGFWGDSATQQYFAGFMVYHRTWFCHDQYALTLGGGAITNPGRYLVLIPPIQGANAVTGSSAYFPISPGLPFNAYDLSITFDYMPNEYITFRSEFNHRWASVPYFVGSGGITSPDGWSTTNSTGWAPDLVQSEDRMTLAMLVRM